MKKYDYIIVGAGIFGATFAQKMHSLGKKCLVIDKRDYFGGLAYTKKIENIDVHVHGAHIFHTNRKGIWDYVNQFSEFNGFINSPIAMYKGKTYNLPFNMNTFSKMWNISKPSEAKEIIENQKNQYGYENPKNLEEQAINMVGKDIYEILIKGYTEKQWGMDAKELPAFIIQRLPVRFTYDNNYFNDKYQGIPIIGYSQMIENMLDGIEVKLNTDYLENKEFYDKLAKKIVYTGPIDQFFNYCYGPLEYRSLRFETNILDMTDYQGNAVFNFTEKEIPYTRIIEHKHFNLKSNQIKTIISKEFPQKWSINEEPYYPINNEKNLDLLQKYKFLTEKETNIIFGGRLAEYKYYNMDQAIASAFKIIKNEIT